jgi:hypothetical protein
LGGEVVAEEGLYIMMEGRRLSGKLCFNVVGNLRECAPGATVDPPLVQKCLKRDPCPQLLHLPLKLIRLCHEVFFSIRCDAHHRTFLHKREQFGHIDQLSTQLTRFIA